MTDGWTDKQMDGRTNEQKSPVFYRTSSPSGPLPKKADLGLKRADIRSERVISTKERADLGLYSG